MVRFFRLALQLLRNTMYALPKEDPLREKLRGAARRINRDVVDAERQLRLGTQDLSIQGAPRAGIPPAGAPPPPAAPAEGAPEAGGCSSRYRRSHQCFSRRRNTIENGIV